MRLKFFIATGRKIVFLGRSLALVHPFTLQPESVDNRLSSHDNETKVKGNGTRVFLLRAVSTTAQYSDTSSATFEMENIFEKAPAIFLAFIECRYKM